MFKRNAVCCINIIFQLIYTTSCVVNKYVLRTSSKTKTLMLRLHHTIITKLCYYESKQPPAKKMTWCFYCTNWSQIITKDACI